MTLSTADYERASSWHLVIAAILIPTTVPSTDEDTDRHWHKQGGLYISRADGSVRWHALGLFGRNPIKLVKALQHHFHGLDYSWSEAEKWLRAFLDKPEHQGSGPLEPELAADSKTRRIANAEWARELVAEAPPLTAEHDGGRCLAARGLPGPWPLSLLWHQNARVAEGAVIAPLTSDGRATAYLLTFVTALGTKSTIKPQRIRLNLEPDHPDAVMMIADREPGVVDINADTIVCEGLENGLSLARVKRPGWRILALPGISAAMHLRPERPGERFIFFQDSDPQGHPAREGLQAGIDALKEAGAKVSVTAFSELGDANAILQHKDPAEADKPQGGEAALTRLLVTSAVAPFSFRHEAERLAKLPRTEYEKARKRIAQEHGVRVGHLDREVALRRHRPADADDDTAAGWDKPPTDEPWPDPVPELGPVLAAAVEGMAQFLVVPRPYLDAVALWSTASHLVQSEEIALPIMPQLGVQSDGPESGKSTLLECIATLAYRGILRSSYTGPTLFRRINEQQVTYCLSDLHTILTDPRSEIHAVIKSCHRRAEAFVDRTEENSGGTRYVATYKCWSALAWGSIGPMTSEMHGRAILLRLQPALPEESRKLDHSSPSRSKVLIDCRRQIAAYCSRLHSLPTPEMPPSLHSRSADNWRPLLALADLFGGDWPQRAREAITEVRKVQPRPDLRERLLVAVRDAFDSHERKDVEAAAQQTNKVLDEADLAAITARPDTKIPTRALLDTLNNDEESGLGEANHGRSITAYWLRDHLHGLLDPPGSQQWEEDSTGSTRKHVRGYKWHQFADAHSRHIPTQRGITPSGVSGVSGADPSSTADLAESATPDAEKTIGDPVGDPVAHPVAEIPCDNTGLRSDTPDTPDTPDAAVGVCEGIDDSTNGEGTTTAAAVKPAETRDPPAAQTARPRRRPRATAKKPGTTKNPSQLDLGVSDGKVPAYTAGTLQDAICKLRAANPKRSLAWLAQKTGQPKSYIRSALGLADDGEAP
jgi:hypothetical protein